MLKIYPVIHYFDCETTLREAEIAKKYGADGVFLISHIGSDEKLIPLAVKIKNDFDLKSGLNLLPFDCMHTANIVKANNIDMVWFDNCGVSSTGLNEEGELIKEFAKNNKNIDIFASVAFKYQKEEINPVMAAINAYEAGFIPTTSGSGTGFAPEVEKIKSMFLPNKTLAVASGMSCENILLFKDNLTHVLVSTGISMDSFHFDEEKIKKFIELARS